MEPLIKNGNTVLVSGILYFFKKPKVNDVVALSFNGKIIIKRITKEEKGNYFIEGDNKKDSLDSRKFGMISKDKILGKVIFNI